jgi:thioesterase domain-containing protein
VNAQPEGPYRLCGNCASGLVAFEVARMLIAAGKEVEMVVMIDPPTMNARRSVQLLFSALNRARPVAGAVVEHTIRWTFRVLSLSDKLWNLPATRRWDFVKDKAKKLFTGGRDQARVAFADFSYGSVVSNYLPKPLAVRVIYFSMEHGLGGAWQRISPDLEVIKLPGTHDSFDLAAFADHLRARLQASKYGEDILRTLILYQRQQ